MSDVNHQPSSDILDQATEAVRDTSAPAGPSADLIAATVTAINDRLIGVLPSERARRQRRRRIMRYVRYGAATAAVVSLATVAGLLWFGGGSAAAHVQKVLDNAEKAKSVKVIAKLVNAEIPGKMTHVQTMYRQGDRIRVETVWSPPEVPVKPVTVADLKTRKMLTLIPELKIAQRGTIEANDSQALLALMGNFAEMKAGLTGGDNKAVKAVGEERIDDRRTKVYEITVNDRKLSTTGVWKVWVDPKTELPARLEGAEGHRGVSLNFEDWNKEFDAKMFSLEVPEGYKATEAPTAVGNASPFAVLLGRVLEKVKQAESVAFTESQTLGDQKPLEMKYSIKGPLVRIEAAGTTILIMDTKRKVGLMLIPPAKAYVKIDKDSPSKIHGPAGASPIADLLALQGRKSESTAEDTLDGRTVQKLTVKGDAKAEPTGDWVIWVDPKTELPVKMTYQGKTFAGDKEVPVSKVYEKFSWNEKIDDKLFRMDVPEGYMEGFPGEVKKSGDQ